MSGCVIRTLRKGDPVGQPEQLPHHIQVCVQKEASGNASTKQNWRALLRIAKLFLADFRKAHADWNFTDLCAALDLPNTPSMRTLAKEAGFSLQEGLSPEQENDILRLMVKGLNVPAEIAGKTSLPLEQVQAFIFDVLPGYGQAGFGVSPYPAFAIPKNLHPAHTRIRRVSAKGQFSYDGHRYGLGKERANQLCWIRTEAGYLYVHFSDGEVIRFKA